MVRIFRFLFLCLWMLLFPAGLLRAEEGDDVLARMIHFSRQNTANLVRNQKTYVAHQ